MQTDTSNSSILDFFYEHISEDDWLEGVDLYQAGKVVSVQDYGGLVTGVISDIRAKYEVRLKVHPSGHQIQWMECMCKTNRVHGRFCEHMAAMMLHIDRESPKLLGSLNTKMPMKPPPTVKRTRQHVTDEAKQSINSEGAQALLIKHLDASIHSVSLLAKGPQLRVRIEIKEGQLTHYDLPIDAAAKFLKKNGKIKTATPEVNELKVYTQPVAMGIRLSQTKDEEIVAEKVIAIKHTKASLAKVDLKAKNGDIAKNFLLRENGSTSKETTYEFFSLKSNSRLIGKEFLFVPGRGYWPLDTKGLSGPWYDIPLKKSFKNDAAAELVLDDYRALRDHGPVWLDPGLSKPSVISAPSIQEIRIQTEKDGWFTLDPRYGSGKSSVSMVELMKHFRKKSREFHKSGDTWLKIPELVKQFDWELDDSGDYLKVNSLGLMRLKAAVGDFDHFAGSKKLLNQLREKVEFQPASSTPSLADSSLDLRSYQEVGLKWFWWLYENQLHGLLADEMGLGKTHQAMALLTAIQKKKKDAKFLVICPTTVLDHWYDKLVDFCPNLDSVKHHGPKRQQNVELAIKTNDVIITSYGILLRDIRSLSKIEWDAIILDEAHFVKNNETATYQAVCRLQARIRICLTGTPMENHLSELKNIFDFLVPGYLGSDDYFKKTYLQPIDGGDSPEIELELQKLIYPFKLRRTKEQVLDDLPEKVEDLRHCGLSDEQVKLYREVIEHKARPIVEQLEQDENPIPYLHVFATITLLKQICDHPALVNKSPNFEKFESGKFDLLKQLLEDALGSDHKVVIYSQYLGMIDIISGYLEKANIKHVTLTGQTRNRGKVIKTFQEDPETKVFIGSLMAGGIGIDLTAASVVIHYDRWWNASKENQATDRVHRIGQSKNVQVLKLVTRGTLEEKIDTMIRNKQQLFEKFLDRDEEVFKSLSRQEIIELLK